MKYLFLISFFLINTIGFSESYKIIDGFNPNDSIPKTKKSLYIQTSGVPSIFNIGYEINTTPKKHFYYGGRVGFGIDFLRYSPYSFELLIATKIAYRINNKHSVFSEIGGQYIFNLWYMADRETYFPNCYKVRCPDDFFNYFLDFGYTYTLHKKWNISAIWCINYYKKSIVQLPSVQINWVI